MKNKNAVWIVKVAMLSAVATVLMLFEFPIPFIAPAFYELDFSEVPVLIGAFALGPVAGVTIEGMKILLNLIINGTITAGIGEIANFITGVVFVFPAAFVYNRHKSRKRAIVGLVVGGVLMAVLGCFINAFVLLPAYSKALKLPVDSIIGMAAKIWPVVDTMFEFVVMCVLPFNVIKIFFVSTVTMLIYKPLSPLLKGKKQ